MTVQRRFAVSFPVTTPFKFAPLLESAEIGIRPSSFAKDEVIFSRGDPNDSVFLIKSGSVKLTTTCKEGRQAVIALLDGGSFFGESCITLNLPLRLYSAIAITETRALKIPRNTMVRLLHSEDDASYMFIIYLLEGMARMQADLVSNLVNSSEQRLARLLLSLAAFRSRNDLDLAIDQQTLAEMIGTARQRVNLMMTRFRRLGFIGDTAGHKVHKSLRKIAPDD